MRIFISGSSGFIGFSLALNLLKKGHKILGYDSMNRYYDIKLKVSRNKLLKKFKLKLSESISIRPFFTHFRIYPIISFF